MTTQTWRVTSFPNNPGVVHISPDQDQHEHRLEPDGQCWCGAWPEQVEGGLLIHHLNLTERITGATP